MVHEMNDVSAEILGAELKNLRIAHGYTQVDVAVAVDITQPSYSDMENGKTKPSLGTLYRLAAYYCISVDDILRHCINLDDEMLFNTDASKDKNKEEADYLSFIHKEKYAALAPLEQKMLFKFNKLGANDQKEMLSYVDFKLTKSNTL